MPDYSFDEKNGIYNVMDLTGMGKNIPKMQDAVAKQKERITQQNPADYLTPQLNYGTGQSTFQQGTQQSREAMASSPWYQQYLKDLGSAKEKVQGWGGEGGAGGGGGGGGGGVETPGYSENFKKFQGGLYGYAQDLMTKESPFGQTAVNLKTRDIDMGNQQKIDSIKADFAARGQAGSPQEQKALEQIDYGAKMQKADVMQKNAEQDAQYGLQKSEVLRSYHDSFNQAEMQNRAMIMQGQQINAAAAAGAASAAAGDAKWQLMMELNLADKAANAGQAYEGEQFGRYMQGAQFDMGKTQWSNEFQYTKTYNNQMIDLNRELAAQAAKTAKSGQIWGAIGGALGAVGGVVGSILGK